MSAARAGARLTGSLRKRPLAKSRMGARGSPKIRNTAASFEPISHDFRLGVLTTTTTITTTTSTTTTITTTTTTTVLLLLLLEQPFQ